MCTPLAGVPSETRNHKASAVTFQKRPYRSRLGSELRRDVDTSVEFVGIELAELHIKRRDRSGVNLRNRPSSFGDRISSTAKAAPTIIVNRYASQNIPFSIGC